MTAPASRSPLPYVTTLVVAFVVIVAGLGRFGIWQPAELRAADAARNDSAALVLAQSKPPLQTAMVRAGFNLLGQTEQGGRLPTALLALLATMALAGAVGSASDRRTGAFVGIAYATMPLVFMNARQMFGGGVAQSVVTLLFAALVYLLWGRPPPRVAGIAYVGLAMVAPAVLGAGWMLGVVPVVLGAGISIVLRWRGETQGKRNVGAVLLGAGALVGAMCARAAVASSHTPLAGYDAWLGVGPEMHSPTPIPTYEAFIEQIGLGLFPWAGLVAFGIVRLLVPPPIEPTEVSPQGELVDAEDAWRESGVRLAAFAFAVIAYGVQSFHAQQFGPSPFIAAAALAVAGGMFLRDIEREALPSRIVTAGATFLTLIVFRDYMLFPKSSYAALGLPDGGPPFPTGFTMKFSELRDWVHTQGGHGLGAVRAFFLSQAPGETYFLAEPLLFIAIALSALYQGAGEVKPFAIDRPFTWLSDIDAPLRFTPLRTRLGGVFARVGISRAIVALVSLVLLAVVLPIGKFAPGLNSIARTALVIIGLIPVIVLVCVYTTLALWNAFALLGRAGSAPMRRLGSRIAYVLVGATVVAVLISQLFVPALSEHLSPRGVWAVIRQVRRDGEPVARFGGNQNDRATRYYASGEVTDIEGEPQAVAWITQRTPRHFMIVGADVFPSLNKAYRASQPAGQRTNLPVIDATNSNLFVVASDAGSRESRNPLDAIVMSTDSQTGSDDHWHPHGRTVNNVLQREPARFDDAVEYLGFNLDSHGQSFVPAGGSFKITHHFRVLRDAPGNHQVFVHIDGPCPRINGDHDPAQGKYGMRYWLAGDFVHDEQTISIPGYCRAGVYTVFLGFFQGDDRMHVAGGDHDAENRVVAARVTVR